MTFLKDKTFLSFLIRFLVLFCLFYFGTLAVIGLAAPEGLYLSFVDKYLDYVSWIKESLIGGARFALSVFGIETYRVPDFIVRIVNGTGVKIAYDCVGYGVMSFWAAFVIASRGSFKRKVIWVVTGFFILWLINVSRISLLLVAFNRHWPMPLGLDHHTWFNIFAYGAIFLMIYIFEKQQTGDLTLSKSNGNSRN